MKICFRYLTAAALLSLSSAQSCARVESGASCSQGCWHESGIVSSDGSRKCEPVGQGHYSPRNNNFRNACPVGTFSNIQTAEMCASCPAGTYASSVGLSECRVCPAGTYSDIPGSAYCSPCDPNYYDDEGANSIQVWNGRIFCVLLTSTMETSLPSMDPTKKTTLAPTNPPATNPTVAPTTRPTTATAPTGIPSESLELPSISTPPHNEPSTKISTEASSIPTMTQFDTDATFNSNGTLPAGTPSSLAPQCQDEEFEWHGRCAQCPTTTREILYPLWLLLFLVIVVSLLRYLPPCSISILWMGLEYLQLLYLLGITAIPWTSTLENLRGVLNIFGLDLDASFSLQCILGVSAHAERVWILLLPFLVWMTVFGLSKLNQNMTKIVGWMAIGLHLGYSKLVLTSWEAMHCSSSASWFCREHMGVAVFGTIALVVYGTVLPVWLLCRLRKSTSGDESYCPVWVHNFPFLSTCWWWSGFWLLRKFIFVTIMARFSLAPHVILTTFLVALMLSEMVQRSSNPSPFEDDGRCVTTVGNEDENQQKKNVWFRHATVDMVLQACFMLLTALSFVYLTVYPEDSGKQMTLDVFFLIVLVPSLVYWVLALFHTHSSCSCERDQEGCLPSAGKNPATSHQHAKNHPSSRRNNTIHRNVTSSSSSNSTVKLPHDDSMAPQKDTCEEYGTTSEGKNEECGWKETQDYEQWLSTEESVVHSCLSRSASRTTKSNRFATLTTMESGDGLYGQDFDASHAISSSTMEYSVSRPDTCQASSFEEQSDIIEYEDVDLETVYASEDGDDGVCFVEDDDATLEIWIDEETGMPIDKLESDQWTDSETGLRAEYGRRGQQENQRQMVLEPCHRVEPFTWGRRLSSVFQPQKPS